ncbi:MAG: hypothetical protein HC890_01450 [Chloroflexaceae bacterium]|nr:hypothetical protein [Chloroflexaceae bacterium]
MLKLIYTDTGFGLELVEQAVEEWLQARLLLSLRASTSFWLDPGRASFGITSNLPCLSAFQQAIERENQAIAPENRLIELSCLDDFSLEVSLRGVWIAQTSDRHEGVFVTRLSDRCEDLLWQLWQEAQIFASLASLSLDLGT